MSLKDKVWRWRIFD